MSLSERWAFLLMIRVGEGGWRAIQEERDREERETEKKIREERRGEKRFNLCLDNAALSRQIIIHEPTYIIPCRRIIIS